MPHAEYARGATTNRAPSELLRLGNHSTLPKNKSAKIALAVLVKTYTNVSILWRGEQLVSRMSRYGQAADQPNVAKLQKLGQYAYGKA